MTDNTPYDVSSTLAVVGMAGRFPQAPDLGTFWRNLRSGADGISRFTVDELRRAGIDADRLSQPSYVPAGGVLDDVEQFDEVAFGFTDREASTMDPQYRLFLETCWLALDNAGCDPDRFDGAVGVYGGMSYGKYLIQNLLPDRALLRSLGDLQLRIHNDKDFLTSLTAYKLNLTGPAVTVQAACSTSLMATVLACQSLLSYQCDMALAGGVSVSVPTPFGYHAVEGVFSPDGRCRPFDAAASGTVQGNGVGIVALRRLEDALADGDPIRALIRGFALNNDGSAKVGYTAPSVDGQAEAIAMAQAVAGITADSVSYIETHGTGTPLGDSIEVAALTEVFREVTDATGFCGLGSVKSNIGHLDAAAGVASLIKTVLALEHEEIPPLPHLETPSPRIPFADSPFYPVIELTPWVRGEKLRRAGVSSFAVGGVNVHLVVEEAPLRPAPEPGRRWQLLPLSARSEGALEAGARRLGEALGEALAEPGGETPELADVAWTLQTGRRLLLHRLAVVCEDPADAARVLAEGDGPRILRATAETRERPLVFLFPGLGNHYVGMARELYETEPVFRAEIDRCAEILSTGGHDLLGRLYADREGEGTGDGSGGEFDLRRMVRGDHGEAAGPLAPTEHAQPAVFAVEVALARLWMSWGFEPAAVAGYSIGQYAAACIAGVFELEDALPLVADRAHRIASLPGGSMLAVSLAEDALRPRLPEGVSVSAVPGPEVTVVGGAPEAVDALVERLEADGVTHRRLPNTHAFHTPLLEPVVEPFRRVLASTELSPPRIPLVADDTGDWIRPEEATDPDFWARHLTRPVRFGDVAATLLEDPSRVFVEIGPGQALGSWLLQHPAADRDETPVVVSTLGHAAEGGSDRRRALEAVGRLWAAGLPVDWRRLHRGERRKESLPGYAFDRRRHWIEPSAEARASQPGAGTGSEAAPGRSPLRDWFHVPGWRRAALPPALESRAVGAEGICNWLLLVGGDTARGLADALEVVLTEQGARVVRDDHHEAFDPQSPDPYGALLDALAADGFNPRRIVHLRSVTGERRPSPEDSFEDSFWSVVRLAQALGARGGIPGDPEDGGFEIHLVSDGAHRVTGGETGVPDKALLAGPLRVLPFEYPGLRCRQVDLDAADLQSAAGRENAARRLCEEWLRTDADSPALVAWRGDTRWVEDWTAQPLDAVDEKDSLLDALFASEGSDGAEGVVLVTGGLGGLGLTFADALARYLESRGGARLALLSRDPEAAGAAERVSALEERGARVLTVAADVTETARLREARAEIERRLGPVRGVVHAAGVPPGGMVQLKEREAVERVLAPKVAGTRAVAEVFSDARFLMLCSSLTARTGSFGLVDHTAANAFLDHFAEERFSPRTGGARRTAPRIVSVAWDAWREVGQAAQAARELLPARDGDGPRAPEGAESLPHPLLGKRHGDDYFAELSPETCWLLDDHRLMGRGVLPGAALLEMAAAAGPEAGEGDAVILEDVELRRLVGAGDGETARLRLSLSPARGGDGHGFEIHQADGVAVRGRRRVGAGEPQRHDLAALSGRLDGEELSRFDLEGDDDAVRFGPHWQDILRSVRVGDGEALAELELPEERRDERRGFDLHPPLLDIALAFPMVLLDGPALLPSGYERVRVHGPLPSHVHSWARWRREDGGLRLDVTLLDDDGRERLTVEGFHLRPTPTPAPAPAALPTPTASADTATGMDDLLGGELGELLGMAEAPTAAAPEAAPTPEAAEGDLPGDAGMTPAEGADAFLRLLASPLRTPRWGVSVHPWDEVLRRAREMASGDGAHSLVHLRGGARRDSGARAAYVPPRNDLERRLVALWEEMLGARRVGVDDGFFDLGGDSLLATQMISHLEAEFEIDLTLHQFFQAPTPAEMAVVVVGRQAEAVADDDMEEMLAEVRSMSPEELARSLEEDE